MWKQKKVPNPLLMKAASIKKLIQRFTPMLLNMITDTLPTPILTSALSVGASIESNPLAGRISSSWPKREIGL
jgi:hypothetical protein